MQKTRVVGAYRKAIETLYIGICSVIVRKTIKNPVTKVSELKEKTVYENLPCRLSFSSAKNNEEELVTSSENTFVLFVAPEIDIPINSKIIVTQNHFEYRLLNAKVKSYATHNEYICSEFVRWA
ncbi:hypothetical protein ABID14_000217 [Peptoniphilus olsenii]|uniref:Uncharacterized protein n=1 Tax=Peptoniphilus olsenii TaxID=411570 RepID=A0ABV2J744_9FIRM